MKPLQKHRKRAGAIIVYTAIMMVMMFAFLAFAVDIGYLTLVRTQLQAAADSAAMAGTWDLLNSHFVTPENTVVKTQSDARESARDYAKKNVIAGSMSTALADADITFGRFDATTGQLTLNNDPSSYNAVQVWVRREAGNENGEVPLFFARVLGIDTERSNAVAMATYSDNIWGFKPPTAGERNLAILPFTLDEYTWNELLEGNASDNWTWDATNERVVPGPDGIREANLYPQGTGSPGNRGTVDLGRSSNSTRDLSDQIRKGVTAEDMARLGGALEPGLDGTITLEADTGMSNGIKDDLQWLVDSADVRQLAPIPDPTNLRVIPIFRNVEGNGNNARYKIVGFAGVRILAVNLTGNPSGRYVMIQPDKMLVDHGIPAPDGTQFSYYMYSKHIWLVR